MASVTGSISLKQGSRYYTLRFLRRGWLAAEFLQFLDDVLEAENREVAILKLLGYTLEISPKRPGRWAQVWVEVDLEKRILVTNADLVRQAVGRETLDAHGAAASPAPVRIHRLLDRFDFTVRLS